MSQRYTVLCVEDNADMQHMLGFIVTKAGYEVVFADNGLDGVQKAQEVKPNLILMDVMMPDMSGIEAVKTLRADSTYEDVPIIILSSYTNNALIDEALEAGATLYLEKTILPKKLTEILQTHLEETNRI